MTRDYKSLSDDDLLNYDDPTTGTMDRYRRIMQHRNNEALLQVAKQLQGVTETIYRASQGAQEKADQVIVKADTFIGKLDEVISRADQALVRADAAAAEQKTQQRAMKSLTLVLAISTVLYTLINAVAAYEAYLANQIQSRVAAIAKDQASAVRQQIALVKEANDLQRESIHSTAAGPPRSKDPLPVQPSTTRK